MDRNVLNAERERLLAKKAKLEKELEQTNEELNRVDMRLKWMESNGVQQAPDAWGTWGEDTFNPYFY